MPVMPGRPGPERLGVLESAWLPNGPRQRLVSRTVAGDMGGSCFRILPDRFVINIYNTYI